MYPGDGQAVTRLAYSPILEAAELLGISRELINDLLRTGDLRVGHGWAPTANQQNRLGPVSSRRSRQQQRPRKAHAGVRRSAEACLQPR